MDYSSLAATSIRQIADKGRTVKLVFKTQGTYKPQSDTIAGQADAPQNVKMLFTVYRRNPMQNAMPGTMVKIYDCKALLAPDNLKRAPKVNDQIVDGDTIYTIADMDTIAPGDTPLLYILHLKRGT